MVTDLGELGNTPTAHTIYASVLFSSKHGRERLRALNRFAPEHHKALGCVLILLARVI